MIDLETQYAWEMMRKRRLADSGEPIFYASLSADAATAETGQTLNKVGTGLTWGIQNGIPCLIRSGYYTYLAATMEPGTLAENTDFTICGWMKTETNNRKFFLASFCKPSTLGGYTENVSVSVDSTVLSCFSGEFRSVKYWAKSTLINPTRWHFYCATHTSGIINLYIDGQVNSTQLETPAFNFVNTGSQVIIGSPADTSYISYIASIRIYDRVISNSEIAQFATEHTPT